MQQPHTILWGGIWGSVMHRTGLSSVLERTLWVLLWHCHFFGSDKPTGHNGRPVRRTFGFCWGIAHVAMPRHCWDICSDEFCWFSFLLWKVTKLKVGESVSWHCFCSLIVVLLLLSGFLLIGVFGDMATAMRISKFCLVQLR